MKFILSISLGFLFLMQALGPTMDVCCELPKLPVLFEHYEEQSEHDGTSFLEFLDFHYGDGQNEEDHHHDDEHDKNLPFHDQHQCSHGAIFITPLMEKVEIPTQSFFTLTQTGFYSFSLCSEHPESPFQPPKA